MRIRYIGLADYLAIAAEITGLGPTALMRVARLGLAEPALHAPAASFGDTEFYPDFIDKAAVLIVHLAKNYPLPDGNKRTAWVTLRLFIEINEWTRRTNPSVDEAEQAVLSRQEVAGSIPAGSMGRFAFVQTVLGILEMAGRGGHEGRESRFLPFSA